MSAHRECIGIVRSWVDDTGGVSLIRLNYEIGRAPSAPEVVAMKARDKLAEAVALLRRSKCGCSPGDGSWCDDRDALLARIDGNW